MYNQINDTLRRCVIDIKLVDLIEFSNSSEFKGKTEISNNSAAEFDPKFISISEIL